MFRIVYCPLQCLGVEIVHVHSAPLTVANDHFWDAVIVHIGYRNGADVLRCADRPARKLPANIVGVNKLPILGNNELLVILTWERRQLQVDPKAAATRPLNSVRARINHLAVGRCDFDC